MFSRFEEIEDEEAVSKSLKRPRDSDAMDVEGLSKSQQKKLSKKLKAENGAAVSAGSEAEEKKSKKEKKTKESEPAKKDAARAVKTLESGLKIEDKTIGTGKQAKKGSFVQMRYIGKLTNGTIFDKNTKGTPVSPLPAYQ